VDSIDCEDNRFSSSRLYYQSFSSDLLLEFLKVHDKTYGYVKLLSHKIQKDQIQLIIDGDIHDIKGILQKEGYTLSLPSNTLHLILESLAKHKTISLCIDDQIFKIESEHFLKTYEQFKTNNKLTSFLPTNLQ
jgi:hypothetical protein